MCNRPSSQERISSAVQIAGKNASLRGGDPLRITEMREKGKRKKPSDSSQGVSEVGIAAHRQTIRELNEQALKRNRTNVIGAGSYRA